MNEIEIHKKEIQYLCVTHMVKFLYLFGSALNSNFNSKSDIDFVVRFENVDLQNYFANYMDLKQKLEGILKRNVDLVEEQTIRNPVFKNSIDRSKQLIYG